MSFSILPTKEFAKEFAKLDGRVRTRIKRKIDEVALDPTRYKRLQYDLAGSSRVWIGKLRVVFSYDLRKREIYLENIVLDHKYRG